MATTRFILSIAIILLYIFTITTDCQQLITTIAGAGTITFGGDGGPAINAALNLPTSVAVNNQGDIYTTSNLLNGYNQIRKISASTGIITTITGNGFADEGPISQGALNAPGALFADNFGNIFIADTNNNRIQKIINSSGIITTVAGTGNAGTSKDGLSALNFELSGPGGVFVDSIGNLFISDTSNSRICKVSFDTGLAKTIAGNGIQGFFGDGGVSTLASLNRPSGIVVDNQGNVFISDTSNHRIRKISSTSGIISTFAGTSTFGFFGDGGLATSAALNSPSQIAMDSFGNLFIADTSNQRIRKVSSLGIITTIAGIGQGFSGDNGLAVNAALSNPFGIAIYSLENIIITDTFNNRIRKISSGVITTISGNGNGDGGPALNSILSNPGSVIQDSTGNIFIAENNRIRKILFPSAIITTFAGTGIQGLSGDNQLATNASFFISNGGMSFDSIGNLIICDAGNNRIRMISALTGIISTIAGIGLFGKPGSFSGDNGLAINAGLNLPTNLVVDSNGNIFFNDQQNFRIRKISFSSKIITTIAGNGGPGFSGDGILATSSQINPSGITIDFFGNIFVSDLNNNRIRKISNTTGIITTIAGNGTASFSGDGGLALNATMTFPNSIIIDSFGNLYFIDIQSLGVERIRKISPNGIITTIAGNGVQSFGGDNNLAINAGLGIFLNYITIDNSGNILMSVQDPNFKDVTNPINRIRKISSTFSCTQNSECICLGMTCQNGQCVGNVSISSSGISCDDGIFCNGIDTCDGSGSCIHSGNNCKTGGTCQNYCSEITKTCAVFKNISCDDGIFCNGEDVCDGNGSCSHLGDPCPTCQQCVESQKFCQPTLPQGCVDNSGKTGQCNGGSCIAKTTNSVSTVITNIIPIIIIPIVLVGVMIIAISIIIIYYRKKIRKNDVELSIPIQEVLNIASCLINNVEIQDKIGGGNFGSVMKGKWNESTMVALKQLNDASQLKEFLSEAKLLHSLRHPNIVSFFGIYLKDQTPLLVMEFMNSGSLLDMLQTKGKSLTQDILKKMVFDTLKGMVYLEEKNIVHCDLAARNLLVSSTQTDFIVKVGDFGLGKIVSSNAYYSKNANFPVKWGAPEVIQYRKYTSLSDVWSFGVVLWEIYSFGTTPYPGMSNQETIEKVSNGYRMPIPKDCPNDIDVIMNKCWIEKIENRPSFSTIVKDSKPFFSEQETPVYKLTTEDASEQKFSNYM